MASYTIDATSPTTSGASQSGDTATTVADPTTVRSEANRTSSNVGDPTTVRPDEPSITATVAPSIPSRSRADRGGVAANDLAANFYQLNGFNNVTVEIIDTSGDRVTSAQYVYAVQKNAILSGGPVTDGYGEVLLNTAFGFDNFVVVGDGESVDYAWFTEAESQETVNSATDSTATIVVDPERASTGGLDCAMGVDFG